MRTKLLILTFVSLLLVGCNSDKKDSLKISESNVNIAFDGGTVNLTVESDRVWNASTDADWFRLSSTSGDKSRVLRLEIDGNISGKRTGHITFTSAGETRTVNVLQLGIADGVDLTYKIPIIFHVLYNDKNNPKQNIPYDQIKRVLRETNELFANAGEGSANLGIEFVLAESDPQGNTLEEPGVVRVHWDSPETNAPMFMNSSDPSDIALVWDPNKYVNIMLYNFQTPNLLGISTFPLVPESHPMAHLETVPREKLTMSDLRKVRCVSINSIHMDKTTSQGRQNMSEVGTTLAHELGHYFGLRHTFGESANALVDCQDTDSCLDTPSYNKQEYDQKIDYILSRYNTDEEYKKRFDPSILFQRDACYSGRYTCRNLMDYDFCRKNQFTNDQKRIVRHVLLYSPFIPGPKLTDASNQTRSLYDEGLELPHSLSNCPESLAVKYSKEIAEIESRDSK